MSVATKPFMRIRPKVGRQQWLSWGRHGYSYIQLILEIMDNSIASKVAATLVNFQVDFDQSRAYIEDDGTGFPVDIDELCRCLEYGSSSPTELNEHGCGLKQALATLAPDLDHDSWRIVWKRDGKIYEIRAPYSDELVVHQLTTWPGTMTDKDHGSYIEFPIKKTHFAELYASGKKAKCDNPLPYIKDELSQAWMLHDRVKSGAATLQLNGISIEPFRLNTISEFEQSSRRINDKRLSTGGKVEVYQFMLNDSVPNSWFKKTGNATGYYFFKNGRFIEKVCEGARFARLMGQETKRWCTGFICIINLVGSQDKLPHTTTAKTGFPASPLLFELYDYISETIRVEKPIEESEESLVRKLIQLRKNNLSGIIPGYKIEEKSTAELSVDGHAPCLTPQMDIIEHIGDKVRIYEAKKDNAIALNALRQLYGNWKIAKMAYSQQVVPVLLIDVNNDLVLPTWLASHLVAWDNMPLIVMNYDGRVLYGTP